MTRPERERYQMFVRVGEFGAAHAAEFPKKSAARKAFDAVAAAVAAIEELAASKVVTPEEGRKAKATLREAIRTRVHAIARNSREDARANPDAADAFPLPAGKSDVALLTTARAFIRTGPGAIARFVPLGLPATTLKELEALVDRFEEVDRGRRAGRTALADAQAGIGAALAQGSDAVQRLDVIVGNTFADDLARLQTWKRARHWKAKPAATARPAPAPPAPPAPAPSPLPPTPAPAPPAPDVAVTTVTTVTPGGDPTPPVTGAPLRRVS